MLAPLTDLGGERGPFAPRCDPELAAPFSVRRTPLAAEAPIALLCPDAPTAALAPEVPDLLRMGAAPPTLQARTGRCVTHLEHLIINEPMQ